jgi:hypothetical protein
VVVLNGDGRHPRELLGNKGYGIDAMRRRNLPVIDAAAAQLPRLNAYSTKLQAALDKVKAGDTARLARPIIDSYQTVWFELHEDLIGAIGMTREEAASSVAVQ